MNSDLFNHVRSLEAKARGLDTVFRSTLTRNNAEAILPFVLEVIKTKEPVLVPFSAFRAQPSTLYKKVSDAILWLVQYNDRDTRPLVDKDTQDQITLLKVRMRLLVSTEHGGIFIMPSKIATRKNASTQFVKDVIEAKTHADAEWKPEFTKFIETAREGETFDRQGLMLSDADIAWIKQFTSVTGSAFNYHNNRLLVVK